MKFIKKKNKIIEIRKLKEGKEYILTKPYLDSSNRIIKFYLSDSFNYLPHGRIDKRVTGIGATHLELISERDSIIVVPLKAIASMKAHKHKPKVIYVGSRTNLHKIELNKKTIPQAIKIFKENKVKYIKIIVVADSLHKVIDGIGENVYKDFFLMIDEIDTFQSDAGYREKLEMTMDYYFKFNKKKRCVVSATLRNFSNPRLQDEPLTIFDFKKPDKKVFTITQTSSIGIDTLVAKKVKKHIKSKKKLLVAYNSIAGVLNVIEKLSPEHKLQCKVLCSKNSEIKVGEYYQQFDVDFKMKTRITFMTSAFYSGVDIEDEYHLICVADGNLNYTLFSLDRIKQVLGRARKGTLSNHFIFTKKSRYVKNELTVDILISIANKTLKALECVRKVYEDDISSGKLMEQVRQSVVKGANIKGYQLLRKIRDENKIKYKIAYFNIDALLENEKTIKDLYRDERDLISNFKERYKVKKIKDDLSIEFEDSSKDVLKERMMGERIKQEEQAIQLIESEFNETSLNEAIKSSTGAKRKILLQYKKIQSLLSKEDAIHSIKEYSIGKRDSRQFNNFYQALIFEALSDNHVFKKKLLEAFPIKSSHTIREIHVLINSVFARGDVGLTELSKPSQTLKQLKRYFKITDPRKKNDNNERYYRIHSTNPYGLKVIKKLGENIKNN